MYMFRARWLNIRRYIIYWGYTNTNLFAHAYCQWSIHLHKVSCYWNSKLLVIRVNTQVANWTLMRSVNVEVRDRIILTQLSYTPERRKTNQSKLMTSMENRECKERERHVCVPNCISLFIISKRVICSPIVLICKAHLSTMMIHLVRLFLV
jgi:hypothetical protein